MRTFATILSVRSRRRWLVAFGLIFIALCFVCIGYRNATRAPIVRELSVAVNEYPAASTSIRLVLISDLHVHGPDMPPQRLARIVRQINALHPDAILIAGDFVGNQWVGKNYSAAEAVAPLAKLKPRLGVYAVLGNNDFGARADGLLAALSAAGVRVLRGDAVTIGPLALGSIDGRLLQGRAAWEKRRRASLHALNQLNGYKVLLVHRPDEFRWLPPAVRLVLAGHTHCGQIVLPIVGALETGSDFGGRYRCGVVVRGRQRLVVTGGIGTSRIPLRIGAPPEFLVITVETKSAAVARARLR